STRFFRVVFTSASEWEVERLEVAEIELSPQYRIGNIEQKALFIANKEAGKETNQPPVPEGNSIPRFSIVNLTPSFHSDSINHQPSTTNHLAWDVPPGNWTILRFGHTTTGKSNHPAPEGGLGLECDKLNQDAVKKVFDGLVGKLATVVGPLTGKSFVATHVDSWEVGSQNW